MLSRRPLSRLAARLSPRRAALSTAADEYTPEYTTSPGPLSDPSEFHSVEHLLAEHLPPDAHRKVMGAMYGLNAGAPVAELPLPPAAAALAAKGDFDVVLHKFGAAAESREPRIVRFGVTQNCIRAPTTAPIDEQYQALQDRHEEFIEAAAAAGTNVLCFQEAWTMPFAFCTREKLPWTDFAESAEDGRSTQWLKRMALKHNMVIVSPILERDDAHGQSIWNTAVVIGNNGNVIGKHRKNHIPRVGDFNESTYYMEGNTGWPVFETAYGKLAINICCTPRHRPAPPAAALRGRNLSACTNGAAQTAATTR